MAKPFKEWTVLPHGKLTRLDDNLLTVTGLLRMPPMGDVERRMTVVRLSAAVQSCTARLRWMRHK